MKISLSISVKKTALFFLFLWFIPVTNAAPSPNHQQESNEEFLKMAETAYYEEDFNAAIKYSNLYLGQLNLTNKNKETAYILLAHIYLAVDDTITAKKSVTNILDINFEYSPTLEMETPKYVNFVGKIKAKYKSKPVYSKEAISAQDRFDINWYIIGGTGAAIAALTIILLAASDGNGKGEPLSLPPPLPE